MQTKLTLRLDEPLIKEAKRFAMQHNKSLSRVVADYFQLLTQQNEKSRPPPITQSLIGVLEGQQIDESDYKKHLEDKYL